MLSSERRMTGLIALVMSLRMIGSFVVVHALTQYAMGLSNHLNSYISQDQLLGLSLGAYGLFQAALQLPLAALSDYWGRKQVACLGLFLFASGSFVCASCTTIAGLILGRSLQGMGAIGSVLMAWAADNTRDEVRNKALAIIGISIGAGFVIALIVGPYLGQHLGIRGVFNLIGLMALLLALPLYQSIQAKVSQTKFTLKSCLTSLNNPALISQNINIFFMHGLFMCFYLSSNKLLQVQFPKYSLLQCYGLVIFSSLPGTMWAMRKATQTRPSQKIVLLAIGLILGSFALISLGPAWKYNLLIGLGLFYTGFNSIESILPSLVSKISLPTYKGAALGMHSSCQFFGIACGSYLNEQLQAQYDTIWILKICTLVALLWLVISATLYLIQSKSLTQIGDKHV